MKLFSEKLSLSFETRIVKTVESHNILDKLTPYNVSISKKNLHRFLTYKNITILKRQPAAIK